MTAAEVVWLVIVGAGLIAFVDAPLRTFRQPFLVARHHERLVLFSIELNLILLWVMAKVFFGMDRSLADPGAAAALAWAGVLVTACGVGIAATARWRLGRWFSATFGIKRDHELITAWPYSMVRHPMYTGIVLGMAGTALVWNSALTLLLAGLMAVPFTFHTVYEELLLEQHFGERFHAYRERVPRLVPFWSRGRARRAAGAAGAPDRTASPPAAEKRGRDSG
jgi:protein-S-isoprenylcysteine O-methyltransferase Ste14